MNINELKLASVVEFYHIVNDNKGQHLARLDIIEKRDYYGGYTLIGFNRI